ncbi:MAG: alpha/beta fold hydrolase [Bacteroidota bacterium]
MELAFRTSGTGFPVVILHGVFGSGDNWLTVTKALAQHYTIYLPDQRNHGRSPQSGEFTYAAMAADLLEFFDKHNLQKAHLIGHSMGGKVAMLFAGLYPERIEKLIVVDISPRYYAPHHSSILAGLNAMNLETLQSRQDADNQLAPYIPEPDVRAFLLKNLYRDESSKFAWRINLPVITANIENIGEALPPHTIIEVPALFMRGELSNYITDADWEEIKRIFTRSQLATIAGSGHWVQAEKPVEFVSEAMKFLA